MTSRFHTKANVDELTVARGTLTKQLTEVRAVVEDERAERPKELAAKLEELQGSLEKRHAKELEAKDSLTRELLAKLEAVRPVVTVVTVVMVVTVVTVVTVGTVVTVVTVVKLEAVRPRALRDTPRAACTPRAPE